MYVHFVRCRIGEFAIPHVWTLIMVKKTLFLCSLKIDGQQLHSCSSMFSGPWPYQFRHKVGKGVRLMVLLVQRNYFFRCKLKSTFVSHFSVYRKMRSHVYFAACRSGITRVNGFKIYSGNKFQLDISHHQAFSFKNFQLEKWVYYKIRVSFMLHLEVLFLIIFVTVCSLFNEGHITFCRLSYRLEPDWLKSPTLFLWRGYTTHPSVNCNVACFCAMYRQSLFFTLLCFWGSGRKSKRRKVKKIFHKK
jgi:hypothetical protein